MVEVAISVKAAARRLSVGRTTLYKVIADGRLPSTTLGKRRLILVEDLNAYLAANKQPPKAA